MTLKKISPEELYEKLNKQEKVVLLDVRAEEKYSDYHIEHSTIENLNINKNDIFNLVENKQDSITSLPKENEIIVTCTTGNSATKCATILSEREYDVTVLDGGITAWKEFLKTK
ncbi:rhodanese-like domain-containing protein [Bacillus sp. RG28]|uniref:Rhodanese-like domain-containing protein n=1 Tax=Gottfriedia endophytica TaxID=2820819 RepID=A0A940SKH0_9BACI|nr:rhodanese-like domain-containing protein [Gottfriedia endophytica]MBP0726019.1 rhodanese-like domain-containing protein [Gottfriedia endophytica]